MDDKVCRLATQLERHLDALPTTPSPSDPCLDISFEDTVDASAFAEIAVVLRCNLDVLDRASRQRPSLRSVDADADLSLVQSIFSSIYQRLTSNSRS